MAAQLKEVVVNADLIELEDFSPNACEYFFDGCPRSDESFVQLRPGLVWRR